MKGIIAQIKDNKAVLLTENGEFVVIANKEYTVGQTVVYKKRNPVKMLAACACFFLMFSTLLSYGAMYIPVSFVDIDINPSIRMKLNMFENVIGIEPLNEDAVKLLENENLSGGFESCVNEIITLSRQKGYIRADNQTVSLYIVSGNSKIKEHAKHLYENNSLDVKIHSSTGKELRNAKKLGVSIGKISNNTKQTDISSSPITKPDAATDAKTSAGNTKDDVKINEDIKNRESLGPNDDSGRKKTQKNNETEKSSETKSTESADKSKTNISDSRSEGKNNTVETDKAAEKALKEQRTETKESLASPKDNRDNGLKDRRNETNNSVDNVDNIENDETQQDKKKTEKKTSVPSKNAVGTKNESDTNKIQTASAPDVTQREANHNTDKTKKEKEEQNNITDTDTPAGKNEPAGKCVSAGSPEKRNNDTASLNGENDIKTTKDTAPATPKAAESGDNQREKQVEKGNDNKHKKEQDSPSNVTDSKTAVTDNSTDKKSTKAKTETGVGSENSSAKTESKSQSGMSRSAPDKKNNTPSSTISEKSHGKSGFSDN